ncbi:hypothetical protein J6I90_06585 [Pseudidiomarina sp. 1APP75-32.1]|uniref:DNA-binding protein n=1 Tax=Pseudidiomarina terrestris TaxID=2820060 RepID=A0AAW7QXE4_9GAMM|nr:MULTISPECIES: hypothetical protein [unclassified Pseudidiomarina]MDN7124543.1 hypothetical protein [Pseudidiomarina sp. 1APP75-32.1]MDN7129166.1 hypothetical protein [Pseudidiomarina sp. 1APR75-15]
MKTYEFSLRFDVSECQLNRDQIDDRLFEAGCDDALVRHGRKGEVLLEFSREDNAALDALMNAKQQVLAALPGARILEAKPDYVGPTDIAKFYDVSRQRIQSILRDKTLGVHAMTCVGNTQIFRLVTVIDVLEEAGTLIENDALREAAFAASQLNRETDVNAYGAV